MNTQQITIDIPQGIAGSITTVQIEQEFKRFIAVKCYLNETMSISQAADIAGMRRIDFETWLSQNQIPISLLTYEDVMTDLEKMNHITAPVRHLSFDLPETAPTMEELEAEAGAKYDAMKESGVDPMIKWRDSLGGKKIFDCGYDYQRSMRGEWD